MIKRLATRYRIEFECGSRYGTFIADFMKDFDIHVYNFSSVCEKPYNEIRWFEMSDSNSWPMDYVEEMVNKLRIAVDKETERRLNVNT